MASGPLKICVCGGDNNTHLVAAFSASNPEAETRILVLNEEEATKWENTLDKKGGMVLTINEESGTKRDVKAKPRLVTSNPKEAINASDLIILTTSALDHEKYLQAIEPFVNRNAVIIGLPGRPGFEYLCYKILGSKADRSLHVSVFRRTVLDIQAHRIWLSSRSPECHEGFGRFNCSWARNLQTTAPDVSSNDTWKSTVVSTF